MIAMMSGFEDRDVIQRQLRSLELLLMRPSKEVKKKITYVSGYVSDLASMLHQPSQISTVRCGFPSFHFGHPENWPAGHNCAVEVRMFNCFYQSVEFCIADVRTSKTFLLPSAILLLRPQCSSPDYHR